MRKKKIFDWMREKEEKLIIIFSFISLLSK